MTIPMQSTLIMENPMRSLMCVASVLVFLAFAGWVTHTAGAASDDETPSIKKIMDTLHKGKKASRSVVTAELKHDSPDWAKVEKQAKVMVRFGAFLAKHDPPRGEKSSFEKLAKSYESHAKALEKAAKNEDLKGARAALKKIGGTCKACHTAHKEQ
jgi:cytochrome c556